MKKQPSSMGAWRDILQQSNLKYGQECFDQSPFQSSNKDKT